ncbi:hypothetical protein HA466_0176310 [Hirschfeldia incana]|nr:hypothetical protein HA466_0176310 [Hirschfeldia incana]
MKGDLSESYGEDSQSGDGVAMKTRVKAALKLEKAIPFSHEMEIVQLKLCDQARYNRLLQSHGGLLNIPSRELLILSLLDHTTRNCGCDRPQEPYTWGVQSSNSGCSAQNNICPYTFQYVDGNGTSGFFVSDFLQFDIHVTLGQTCCLILD